MGDILPTLESSDNREISGERMTPPWKEKESEATPLLDETRRAVPCLAENAERRYQELKRGEVTAQESEEVFREARARLKSFQPALEEGDI